MAIGQLFDYQFLHRRETGVTANLGMLLPARPDDDLLELAGALAIAVIWPGPNGRQPPRACGKTPRAPPPADGSAVVWARELRPSARAETAHCVRHSFRAKSL